MVLSMKQSFSQNLKKDLVQDPEKSSGTRVSGSEGVHVRGDDATVVHSIEALG